MFAPSALQSARAREASVAAGWRVRGDKSAGGKDKGKGELCGLYAFYVVVCCVGGGCAFSLLLLICCELLSFIQPYLITPLSTNAYLYPNPLTPSPTNTLTH